MLKQYKEVILTVAKSHKTRAGKKRRCFNFSVESMLVEASILQISLRFAY